MTLSNASDVPLNYCAHVPNDGCQPPICFDRLFCLAIECDEYPECDGPDVEQVSEAVPQSGTETGNTEPKEFTVQPSSGVLQPRSAVTFTVALCPNSMSTYFRELAVNFDEVANKTFTIPITAQYAN